MTEPMLHVCNAPALVKKDGRRGVAQVMEAHPRQSVSSEDPLEAPRDAVGSERSPVLTVKHVSIRRAFARPQGAQLLRHLRKQRKRATTARCLDAVLLDDRDVLDDGGRDPQLLELEINGAPLEAKDLAAAQAVIQSDKHQRVQAVALERSDNRPGVCQGNKLCLRGQLLRPWQPHRLCRVGGNQLVKNRLSEGLLNNIQMLPNGDGGKAALLAVAPATVPL